MEFSKAFKFMEIDQQLVAECELILSKVQLDKNMAHLLQSQLHWYRAWCNNEEGYAGVSYDYKTWLENSLSKAKRILAEERYNENKPEI